MNGQLFPSSTPLPLYPFTPLKEGAMEEREDEGRRIACIRCRYYQVTWDARRPYGCRAHGFKTHRNPAVVVYETSGIECQLFEPKTRNSESS